MEVKRSHEVDYKLQTVQRDLGDNQHAIDSSECKPQPSLWQITKAWKWISCTKKFAVRQSTICTYIF
jgi:hypothetical protein